MNRTDRTTDDLIRAIWNHVHFEYQLDDFTWFYDTGIQDYMIAMIAAYQAAGCITEEDGQLVWTEKMRMFYTNSSGHFDRVVLDHVTHAEHTGMMIPRPKQRALTHRDLRNVFVLKG